MSLRRCATPRCPGTLPAGTGKHCPRCGGTAFIRRRHFGFRPLFVVLVIVLAIAATTLLFARRAETAKRSAVPIERQALVEARDLAARMTIASDRDDAYANIIQRALEQHDFEYACELGGEMTIASNKDQCMLEAVEAALKAHQPAWATRAADEIVIPSDQDSAFRKIMDATSQK